MVYLFRVLFDQSQPACVCHNPPVYVTTRLCMSQPTCVCHNPPVYVTTRLCMSQPTCVCHNPPVYVTTHMCMSQPTCVCHNPPVYVTVCVCQSSVCVCQSPVCVCQSPVDGHLVNPHQYPWDGITRDYGPNEDNISNIELPIIAHPPGGLDPLCRSRSHTDGSSGSCMESTPNHRGLDIMPVVGGKPWNGLLGEIVQWLIAPLCQ